MRTPGPDDSTPCSPDELGGLDPKDLFNAGLETSPPVTLPPQPADPDVTVRVSPSSTGIKLEVREELPLPEELTALLPADSYQVDSFLGQGGMGAVYRGQQVRLKRPVAIKIMRRDRGKDYDFEARFEREAQAMAKLSHPNIVSIIDYGQAGADYLYIVMELIDGADLMDVIRSGQMTQEMALTLLPQICDALQFAHDHGIVHRDIKPSNIMLTRDGRIKMADFGLAKRFDTESSFRTQTGTGMGTPDYAAPEQFDPNACIDHRADIYALGVMIYQMITGSLPRGVWKPPSQRVEVAPAWDDIVSRAMQSDPADRYQTASDIKTDVSSIPLAGKEGSAGTPARSSSKGGAAAKTSAADKSVRAPFTSRAPLLIGLIVGVVVISAAAFFMLKKPGQSITPTASVSASPSLPVSIPGLPDLPPLTIPPGEPGLVKELVVKGGYLKGLELLPDCRRMLAFPDGTITLIDLESETPVWTQSALGAVSSSAISRDGSRFVDYRMLLANGVVKDDQLLAVRAKVTLYETATGKVIQSWVHPITKMAWAYSQVALSPSGKRIVARVGGEVDHADALFAAFEDGNEGPVAQWSAPGHNGHMTQALDEDRYTSTGNGSPLLLRISQPGAVAPLLNDLAELRSRVSPDKRWITSAFRGSGGAVWSLETRTVASLLEGFPATPSPAPSIVDFAGSELIVAAGQYDAKAEVPDKHLYVWSRATGALLARFRPAHPGEWFSPLLRGAENGSFCAIRTQHDPKPPSGENNLVQIWSLPKPGKIHRSAKPQ